MRRRVIVMREETKTNDVDNVGRGLVGGGKERSRGEEGREGRRERREERVDASVALRGFHLHGVFDENRWDVLSSGSDDQFLDAPRDLKTRERRERGGERWREREKEKERGRLNRDSDRCRIR